MFFSFLCFQAQKQVNIINKIEKEIKNRKIIKKESNRKTSWNGGYETITIHLKKKTPILIEKKENQVMHLYTSTGESDIATLISAKFYITNWNKKEYVRTGVIHYIGNPYKPNPNEEKITEMPKEYKFEFDKIEIENLINSEN